MFAQFGAKCPAVHAVACGFSRRRFHLIGGFWLATALGACQQTAPPSVAADPADPNAKVAGAGYRSTTSPYTPMRPAEPAPWAGQDRRAPAPNADKKERR